MIATIYPDRITVREPKPFNAYDFYERKIEREFAKQNNNSLNNLKKPRTDFSLSKTTIRKIRDTFNLLYEITPARTVVTQSKKKIYNFRLSFVTLTLPAPQQHSDTEIKKKCLNNFLSIMRNRFGLRNYIWVAELQQNQNIHFHLVFDLYISHHAIRYYWNQSLELLGYVSAYSSKFQAMSLSDYAKYRNKSIEEVSRAFIRNCRNKWKNPPTEQAIAIKNTDSLVYYLSKYIAKNVQNSEALDMDRLESFGRSWARSESLSAIKYISTWCWDSIKARITTFGDLSDFFIERVYDYCTVFYVKRRLKSVKFKNWLSRHMRNVAEASNYTLSGLDPVPIKI